MGLYDFAHKAISQLYEIALTLIVPSTYAAFGRLASYVHGRSPITWRLLIGECAIVIFMGVVTGGITSFLGFTDMRIAGGFIAMASFYGPKLLILLFEIFICEIKSKFIKKTCDLHIFDNIKPKDDTKND